MGIIAGLLVQNSLKYLLAFGSVTPYLGYNALDDFFPTYRMKPNPECEDSFCRRRQKEVESAEASSRGNASVQPEVPAVVVQHEDNDWGISVVDESAPVSTDNSHITPGLRLAYEAVRSCSAPAETDSSPSTVDNNEGTTETDLDSLMAQLKGM